jgi:hypothetical protein
LGKSTLLDLFEQEIRRRPFTPYIARLDFAQASLHDPVAALTELINQLEATGATTEKTGWLGRKRTLSPLLAALETLQPKVVTVNQEISIKGVNSHVAGIENRADVPVGSIPQAQLNEALGKLKLGIAKLPVLPMFPDKYTALKRPLVVVLVDTLELAPPPIVDLVRQLAAPMFGEYLLLVAAGQEKLDGLLTKPLERLDDRAARDLLAKRFGMFDSAQTEQIVQLARGIPRCLALAGAFVRQAADSGLETIVPGNIEEHLVTDYLVRGILNRLPDSSPEKYLLLYGCVLRRWESTEQLRDVLFDVPQVRAMIGENTDIRAALNRLRERSFLDSGHPHATLRDLLLHDLEREEPSILHALHCSAATWFTKAGRIGDAAPHLLATQDWGELLRLWREALNNESKAEVEALFEHINAKSFPETYHVEAYILLVESGLLLHNGALLPPILTLLQRANATNRPSLEALAQRVSEAEYAPAELRARLRLELAHDDAARAQALLELGDVLRLQDRYDEAAAAFEEARALFTAIDDRRGLANALRGLGEVLRLQDR